MWTRALANRLQNVIHKIVSLDQKGYIKDRFIRLNLRLIQDVIIQKYYKLKKLYCTLILERPLTLWQIMFLLRFLDTLVLNLILLTGWKYFTMISKRVSLTLVTDQILFNLKRGIKQGCPLSSLLFVIAAEI